MNKLVLRPIITDEDKRTFTAEIQSAFQNAYTDEFGAFDKTILPTEDIEDSFNADGSEAYFAEVGGEIVGGTIIVIENKTAGNIPEENNYFFRFEKEMK